MKISFIKKYSFLIGFFLLFIVFYQLNLKTLFSALENIDYLFLIIAMLLIIPTILAKSWRWNYLKKIQAINYRIIDSFLMYSVGTAIGLLTPGRIGEISKINYLKNNGYSTGQSLVSVVMDRLLDFFYLIIFGYLGIIFFFGFLEKTTFIYSLVILLILGVILITRKQFFNKLIKKIFYLIIPIKYQKYWQSNFSDFSNDLKIYTSKNYFSAILITIISWLIYYLHIYFIAKSIHLESVPTFYLMIAITVSSLITLLPLSFLGIGTREATLLILLTPLADNPEIIVLLAELILLNTVMVGLNGIISWIFKPLPINQIFSKKQI